MGMTKNAGARSPRARLGRRAPRLRHGAMLACMACGGANAGTTDFGQGVEAVWSLGVTYTSDWRTTKPDAELVGIGDGGQASAATHSHDLNFASGGNFTKLLRVVGDVDLHKGDTGLVLRAKAWDNFRYSSESVSFGAPSNGFVPDTRLRDGQFDTKLSKFKGVELFDAYVYSQFDLSDSSQLKVRLGQHAVNFGESLYVPGVNQYQVLDVTALRQPGTQLKEAILPVPQVSANLGLGGGASLEAFYQFGWRRTVIDGCGTYWSPATALNCVDGSILVGGDGTSEAGWNGTPNFQFSRLPDKLPGKGGQFGLALKKMVEAIDTELGLYFVNYTTHLPNLSAVRRATDAADAVQHPAGSVYAFPSSVTGLLAQDASIYWDYSARDIRVAGLSASTAVGDWSLGSEFSFTSGFPVQVNSVDAFIALAQGAGPVAARYAGTDAKTMLGYDRKDKTQLQLSTLRLLPSALGSAGGSFLGEVAFQHWSGIGDPATGVRYGRGFEFGAAQHASFGGACPAAATNANNCTQDGYFTSDAWGLRAQLEMEYPGVISNVVLKPRLFVSEDVRGWSADGVFSQRRRAVSPGLKFDFDKRFSLDFSYTAFNHKARFDSFHDRDFVGVVLGASL